MQMEKQLKKNTSGARKNFELDTEVLFIATRLSILHYKDRNSNKCYVVYMFSVPGIHTYNKYKCISTACLLYKSSGMNYVDLLNKLLLSIKLNLLYD